MLFTIGMLFLGLGIGAPLSTLIIHLPVAMERRWHFEAVEFLGLPMPTGGPPKHWSSLLLDQFNARYAYTIAGYGLISGWAACHYGTAPTVIAALVLAWGLLAMSIIDLDHQLLPDVLVMPLLWLGLIINNAELFTSIQNAVWGAAAGYSALWTLRNFTKWFNGKEVIGLGDAKLMALLGAWGGWQILPGTLIMALVSVVIIGGGLIALGRLDRASRLSFGPFLALAGWLNLLYLQAWSTIIL